MRILFIVNDAPYGTERVYNALRLAHALAKHDTTGEIAVFLMADAVLAAKAKQKTPEGFYNVERMLKRVMIGKGRRIQPASALRFACLSLDTTFVDFGAHPQPGATRPQALIHITCTQVRQAYPSLMAEPIKAKSIYATLGAISSVERNVMTIEDPVTLSAPWGLNLVYERARGLDRMINDDYDNDRSEVEDGLFTIVPPEE
ncbi:MAG: hypothetical protein HC869_01850 [Rhodospirillales bacterium]|nr:hypothetical protein [Rhodospirillales bacterium]